jgi:hypothetical protein
MKPREFKTEHPEKWAKLVPAWANLSGFSDKHACRDLIENDMGTYVILKKDEKWSFYHDGEIVFTFDEDQPGDWW